MQFFQLDSVGSLLTNLAPSRRRLPLLLAAAAVIAIGVELSPLLQSEASLVSRSQTELDRRLFDQGTPQYRGEGAGDAVSSAVIDLNALLELEFRLSFFEGETRVRSAVARVRWDRLILFSGSLAIVLLVLLFTDSPAFRIAPLAAAGSARSASGDGYPVPNTESILRANLQSAEKRSEEMFSRSALLLAAGIVLTLMGVGIFYATLPASSGDEGLIDYLPKALRSTSVLVFVEGIAWFLFRQYRALIEDYKQLHRLYLKRANYMAAYSILSSEKLRPQELFLAASLLHEDLPGALLAGEAVESLEREKISDQNPAQHLLNLIVERMARAF